MKHTLDTTGLRCPMPVLKAKRVLRDIPSGDYLQITATDKASVKDFPAFCELTGNKLIDSLEKESTYIFIIEKK